MIELIMDQYGQPIYFLINHTRRQILHADSRNILLYIREAMERFDWSIMDSVDLLDDSSIDIRGLVEKIGYTIDSKCWE
jgi:hypothetical protein